MTVYSVRVFDGTAEVAAFAERHEAEAYIAGQPEPHRLSVVELPREAQLCAICGRQAITASVEQTDFCRACHYSGAANERRLAALIDRIEGELDSAQAVVWHTGGGCFLLAITRGDDEYPLIAATEAIKDDGDDTWFPEAGLPDDADGPWGVVLYRSEAEWENGDYDGLPMVAPATADQLVAFVREQLGTVTAG